MQGVGAPTLLGKTRTVPKLPAPSKWLAGEVLNGVAELVGGDRAKTHGDKLTNHQNIARLWSAFLQVNITADQVALMMVLLKVARTQHGGLNHDDYADMAGYAAVAAECVGKMNGLT
jgi:hypothetical protein